MSVRADHDGKIMKRSILGSIDDFMRTTDQKNQVHTHSVSEETSKSHGRRNAGVRRSVGSNISNNGFNGPSRPRGGNRLNFSVDLNAPGMSQPSGSRTGLFSEDGHNLPITESKLDANKLLRSLNFMKPISQARERRVGETYNKTLRLTESITSYIKERIKVQKESLIEQQQKYGISREDYYLPTETNEGKPFFQAKKGDSRDLPDAVRGFYQNLRFGKQGCGVVYEPLNAKNSYTMLWACSPSPKRISNNFKNQLQKALSLSSANNQLADS